MIDIDDLTFTFDLNIRVGRQCFIIMPVRLSGCEIQTLYKMAFGRDLENPEELTDKEGDLLEDYICIYISNNLNNAEVINNFISDWLSAQK